MCENNRAVSNLYFDSELEHGSDIKCRCFTKRVVRHRATSQSLCHLRARVTLEWFALSLQSNHQTFPIHNALVDIAVRVSGHPTNNDIMNTHRDDHDPLFADEICCIGQENIGVVREDGITEEVCTTICGHRFGAECLDTWLQEQNSCPMCRHQLIDSHDDSGGPFLDSDEDSDEPLIGNLLELVDAVLGNAQPNGDLYVNSQPRLIQESIFQLITDDFLDNEIQDLLHNWAESENLSDYCEDVLDVLVALPQPRNRGLEMLLVFLWELVVGTDEAKLLSALYTVWT